jgi:hypothetical protein
VQGGGSSRGDSIRRSVDQGGKLREREARVCGEGGGKPPHRKGGTRLHGRDKTIRVIVKASKSSEAGVLPDEKLLAEMGRFNEELAKAGLLLAGEGLHPSSKSARVRFSGDMRTVVTGPFAETKDLVAGFGIWRCKSLQEAIEWVKRCPNLMPGHEAEIETRQVLEAEDFGPALTPELKAKEQRARANVEKGEPS